MKWEIKGQDIPQQLMYRQSWRAFWKSPWDVPVLLMKLFSGWKKISILGTNLCNCWIIMIYQTSDSTEFCYMLWNVILNISDGFWWCYCNLRLPGMWTTDWHQQFLMIPTDYMSPKLFQLLLTDGFQNFLFHVIFEISTALVLRILAFWDVMLCSMVNRYGIFEGLYCCYLQFVVLLGLYYHWRYSTMVLWNNGIC
jgi:hypothetical protein